MKNFEHRKHHYTNNFLKITHSRYGKHYINKHFFFTDILTQLYFI